jgi:PAS domain S-box-containing protein
MLNGDGDLPVDALRLFHDLPFIGMAITSPTTKRWLHVNQTLCALLGYPREELVTRTWAELTHPDDLAADLHLFEEMLSGRRDGYVMDKRFMRRDGAAVHTTLDVKAIRSEDGTITYLVATVADRTGRHEALEQARASASLLRNLVRQVPGVVYQFQLFPDERARFPFASEGIADIYEVSAAEVQQDATVLFGRLHPQDLDAVWTSILESARDLTRWRATYRVVLPTRGERWLRGDAQPERLADGSTLWHGYITDVTEQEASRLALRESEQRYRIQFEHAPEAIVLYDPATDRFVDGNVRAERLFGLSGDDLRARGIVDVSAPVQAGGRLASESGREYLMRAVAGEPQVFEWVHRHADGSDIACEVHLVPLPFEGRTLVRGTMIDIRERKRLLGTLLRLDAAISSSISGVAIADLTGNLTYVNQAFLRIWGYDDPAQVLGRPAVSFWSSSEKAQAVVTALLTTGRWTGELVATRTDGAERTLLVQASTFSDAHGQAAGLLASFVDVTEERRLQAQLLQSQKLESVGRLAGGVAHDFNNLLTVIRGYLELSLQSLREDNPLVDYLTEVDRAADSAAGLTQQLLAFSRKQIIAPQVLDLNDVVQRVDAMLQRLLGEHIALEVHPGADLWRVRFDPGQAEQILVNLAVNARDAMPDGGRLTIETSNVRLDSAYAETHPDAHPGEYVLLAVSDTGEGMSSETRAHAFEPFFTTKQPGHGTGLGLAMIHGAVSQNGGRVEVYSELGHGTSFKIYLPRTVGTIASTDEPALRTSPAGRETILVAEDDERVRMLTVRLLSRLGYRAIAVGSGDEALAWLDTHAEPIDLLLTDVIMPGMNGKTLAERVRAVRPGTRVLFTSGYTANVIVHHGVLKPGVEFLAKPFSGSSLAQKVREVLDG